MRRRDFLKNSALASTALALNPWLPHSLGQAIGAQVSDTSRTAIKKQAAYLVLEGPPRARGRIHGEALRSQINALMEIWKDQLGRQYKVDPKQYIQKFLADTKEALSSKDDSRNPVCLERRPDGRGSFTAGCLIMELSEKPKLHFAPGPPCAMEFQTFAFADGL
jgi:hypothetical protein